MILNIIEYYLLYALHVFVYTRNLISFVNFYKRFLLIY